MTAAAVVDHVEAHQGDHEKFWDPDNWQSLCKRHHDSAKQRQEKKRPEGVGGQKVRDSSLWDRCPRKTSASAKFDRGVK